jgi:bifunctional DNase/RNase
LVLQEFLPLGIFYSDDEYLLVMRGVNDEEKFLPMVIGDFEANGILAVLEDSQDAVPMIYDAFSKILIDNYVEMEKLVIYDLKEGIYFARIYSGEAAGKGSFYDIRPSDGVAMALRLGVPVFATEEVLEKVSMDDSLKELIESGLKQEKESMGIEDGCSNRMDYGHEKRLKSLLIQLEWAVKEEKYEEAAKIRDEIAKIKKLSERILS